MHEVAVVVVQLWPPAEAVAVYPVMGLPPVLVGAVHEIVAWALPGVAVMLSGGCGGKIMRETVALSKFVTHTLDPSGLTATLRGLVPTVIEVTLLVVVLIRETVVPASFVTHTLDPSGLTATPRGLVPTAIEVTASVAVLTRETVALSKFVTQTLDPSGLTARS